MFIQQVSVFLENTKGTLCHMTRLLARENINLLAMSVADTAGFGIVRLIVRSSEIEKAVSALRNDGEMAKVNEVVCVRIPNEPGGLSHVLTVLEEGGVSIEYAYSFCRSNIQDALIILRPSDKALCIRCLTEKEIRLVSQDEVDQF